MFNFKDAGQKAVNGIISNCIHSARKMCSDRRNPNNYDRDPRCDHDQNELTTREPQDCLGCVNIDERSRKPGCYPSDVDEAGRAIQEILLLSGEIGSEDPFHFDWPHW
jgi:hypothetical protein